MAVCFAVEAHHKVIGVAVRCIGGFRFFCSDPAYRALDKRLFPNARAVDRSVAGFAAHA